MKCKASENTMPLGAPGRSCIGAPAIEKPSPSVQTLLNPGRFSNQTTHRLLNIPMAANPASTTNHQLSNPLKTQLAMQRAMGPIGAARSSGTQNQVTVPFANASSVNRIENASDEDSSSGVGSIAAGAVAIGAGAVAISRGGALEAAKNTVGVAGAGKYSFQAVRVAHGLGTTTRATVALDLLGGSLGMGSAVSADAANVGVNAAKGLATEAKAIAGAGKLSGMSKFANVATKAAPVIAKGAAVVGVGVGAYGIYDGVQELRSGNEEEGREKIVDGTADVVTSAALGVAAISSGTVVGLPVAAVALGVAGVSQAAKYAYKFSDEIGSGASWVASKVSNLWD